MPELLKVLLMVVPMLSMLRVRVPALLNADAAPARLSWMLPLPVMAKLPPTRLLRRAPLLMVIAPLPLNAAAPAVFKLPPLIDFSALPVRFSWPSVLRFSVVLRLPLVKLATPSTLSGPLPLSVPPAMFRVPSRSIVESSVTFSVLVLSASVSVLNRLPVTCALSTVTVMLAGARSMITSCPATGALPRLQLLPVP